MSELVELSQDDMVLGIRVGVRRNMRAWLHGRALEQGRTDHGWEHHINGALAEQAVARWLAWPYDPDDQLDTLTGDLRCGDAAVHVKATTLSGGRLLVREHDPDDLPYVLVRLRSPRQLWLVGWAWGYEAKQPRHWTDNTKMHRACYMLRGEYLRHMANLPGALAKEATPL